MDLTSLLAGAGGGEVGAGPSKTNTMEELRQAQYKRTGAKTATERRTLRSIQVGQKRADSRTARLNVGRKMEEAVPEDENRKPTNVGGAPQRMSRKDKLADYLAKKKAIQERQTKKAVKPFRAGVVHHPTDSLAALPPVPGSKFGPRGAAAASSKKSTVKKVASPRVSLRTRYAQKTAATSVAGRVNMSREPAPARAVSAAAAKGKASSLAAAKTPLLSKGNVGKRPQKSGSTPSVSKRGGQTPKVAGKSFAPKNFQFKMNLPMPEARNKAEEAPAEVAKPVEDATEATTAPDDAVAVMEKSPAASVDPKTPEKEQPTTRRRSRRMSGVAPDPTLTPAQLRLTPAKRAKERSVSRDRRPSAVFEDPWVVPATASNSAAKALLLPLAETEEKAQEQSPALSRRRSTRGSKASTEVGEAAAEEVVKDEVPKTPIQNLAKVAPLSTARRRTRRSMMVIEETEQEHQEDETMTPVSNILNKMKNTVLESGHKEDLPGFKTPKSTRVNKVKNDSEASMKMRSPLASVNSVRGSSKRKRNSPDAKESVASLFDDLEGSPLLAKLEAKKQSNEEITEEDLITAAPVAKQLKLADDFDDIAEEQPEPVTTEANTEPKQDVSYFRTLLKTETARLTAICDSWEQKLEDNLEKIEEDIQGEIRSVIGQGRLVMAERFHQFTGLVDNCEFKRGEKETTCMDLMGFWEMIYFQVTDVDNKFAKLTTIENNDWKEVVPKPTVARKKVAKKPTAAAGPKKAASSGLRAMIAAKRKAAMAQETSEAPSSASVPKVEVAVSPVRQTRKSVANSPAVAVMEQSPAAAMDNNQFDGGFFKIVSPARTSPSVSKTGSPKLATPGSTEKQNRRSVGGDALLRRAVLNDSSRRSVSGLLLSPYITQAARRSLPSPASPLRSTSPSAPATDILVNITPEIVDPVAPLSSPVTKTYSRTGVSPAAKQRENDAFDLMVTGASPRIRVDTVTPSEDVELINFASPKVNADVPTTPAPVEKSSRRSSRVRTPLVKK